MIKTITRTIGKVCLALSMLFFAAANAMAGGKVSMENLSIAPGDTKTVSIILTQDEAWGNLGLNIELPTGLSYVDGSLTKNREVLTGTKQDVDMTLQADGSWLLTIAANSPSYVFQANGQALVSFDVTADSKLAKTSQIVLRDGEATYNTKTAEGKTKINTVVLTEAKATVTNIKLAGYTALTANPASLTMKVGKTKDIVLSLENSMDLVALQFDMVLPAGIELVENAEEEYFTTTSRTEGFSVRVSPKAGNTYSVAISNSKNIGLGNSGDLVGFTVLAKKAVNAQEILVTNVKGSEVNMEKTLIADMKIAITTEEANFVPSAIEELTLVPGESQAIAVALENNTEICGLQGEIVLPAGLEFEAIDDEYLGTTDRLPLTGLRMTPSVNGNKMNFIISSTGNVNFKGESGDLFIFYVKATNDFKANGTITISGLKASEKDMTKYDIPNTVEIAAKIGFTDPTMDGIWDINDLQKILKAQAGDADTTNCDLNNDGHVDIYDIQIFLKRQAGIED